MESQRQQRVIEPTLLDGINLSTAIDEWISNDGGKCLANVSSTSTATFRTLAPAPLERSDPMRGDMRAGPRPPPMPQSAPPAPLREQDRLLPMANVARLMSIELPKDAKISRDAKLLMQEMVSEFICFVTSEANDFCVATNRKAIAPENTIQALESLGALRTLALESLLTSATLADPERRAALCARIMV